MKKSHGEGKQRPLSEHPLMNELEELIRRLPEDRQRKLMESLESGEIEAGDRSHGHEEDATGD